MPVRHPAPPTSRCNPALVPPCLDRQARSRRASSVDPMRSARSATALSVHPRPISDTPRRADRSATACPSFLSLSLHPDRSRPFRVAPCLDRQPRQDTPSPRPVRCSPVFRSATAQPIAPDQARPPRASPRRSDAVPALAGPGRSATAFPVLAIPRPFRPVRTGPSPANPPAPRPPSHFVPDANPRRFLSSPTSTARPNPVVPYQTDRADPVRVARCLDRPVDPTPCHVTTTNADPT
jgi:hypothetical protein